VRSDTPSHLESLYTWHSSHEPSLTLVTRFIASAGTYANLVKQAKSKQKIIDKMEAAGLIEKVETVRPLRFNFEDIRKLPPPIIAFDNVAFSYSGKKEDYLYKGLSFGIECVSFSPLPRYGLGYPSY
jgi:ATP-binding cassette, subfamily F, member 2